ncbi:hypothetical protein GP486_008425, partial [Trichoglossum hirsutum]
GKYVVIMIDIDVNINGNNTNLIHWIQGNFTAAPGSTQLSSPSTIVAPYFAPNPPPGQTHRYVEMLFNEPQGFSIPAPFTAFFANLTASVFNRIGFELDKFIDQSKLGNPVAANYFRVSTPNTTSSSSSGGGGATPSASNTASINPTVNPTRPTTNSTSAPIPSNDGVADRVLNAPMLAFLAMLGIAINMI